MKIKQRHKSIIEFIRRKNKVTVGELAIEFQTSCETIRRDLSKLANLGKIQKIHGGAAVPKTLVESLFQSRILENTEAKIKIAQMAAKLFINDETLFVDTGSTTLYFAEELLNIGTQVKLITNSIEIARTVASNPHNQVFLLGGEYNHSNSQTVGAMVQCQINELRAHHSVLTIGALNAKFGAMAFNIDEAQIDQSFIKQSASITILVDDSKFNNLTTFTICDLMTIDRIVCNVAPKGDLRAALIASNVEIIVAS